MAPGHAPTSFSGQRNGEFSVGHAVQSPLLSVLVGVLELPQFLGILVNEIGLPAADVAHSASGLPVGICLTLFPVAAVGENSRSSQSASDA